MNNDAAEPGRPQANRLAGETSPYLQQHAHNPVNWFPWGDEALVTAKAEDLPILLSVGYAACHWCHVMEQESFEDADTAALMNEHFVSVKVDREERPDIDSLYMEAVQAMTGSGGWPMTVFCTPDGEPFFAGTYFPKDDRFGMPAFKRVLTGIAQAWTGDREQVLTQAAKIVEAISASAPGAAQASLSEGILSEALEGLGQSFDAEWGGWGGGPKFPQAMTIEFLLRSTARLDSALPMATFTLDAMANGGIYDQLGGGFHRYAVDRQWHVPHFEKMLYDNAQLARTYAHAWQVTGNERYRRISVETLEYLLREMQHAQGGFFSSQDADSEGREGVFFAWSWDELVAVAGEDAARSYNASPEGNWEEANVLWTPRGEAVDAGARRALFELRKSRVHPATDDKILAAWNGLAIAAFAEAGRIFADSRYTRAAVRAADFVLSEMRGSDGRLLRSWREGQPGRPGFADDYALMAGALLTLYEATFEMKYFDAARSLADDLVRLFADRDAGGFFQTGTDAEALVIRPKELLDNAVPSGNSAGAELLLRLAALTGDESYERAAAGALETIAGAMGKYPTGFGLALSALGAQVAPPREIAIIGTPGAPDTEALAAEVWNRFLPGRVLAVASPEQAASAAAGGFALLEGRTMQEEKATAYVCERFVCKLPVTGAVELGALLDAGQPV